MLHDIRYALRGFRLRPGFALAAVLVIALGIGASTAVFSVVDRVLFRALPYPHGDRLVTAGISAPIVPEEFLFGAHYLDFREHQAAFEAVSSWTGTGDCDLTDRDPLRLSCAKVESTFLATLGVAPILGRDFSRDDDRPGAQPVALLSYGFWRSRFGGNAEIEGKTISIDGQTTRVVGVLPATFELPTLAHADLLVPQLQDDAALRRNVSGRPMWIVARLKPEETASMAQAAIQPWFEHLLGSLPPPMRKEIRFAVRSVRERQVKDVRAASWVLMGAVAMVLLIACANVANLLLVRGVGRQREISIRMALGATRRDLLRLALVESLLVGFTGGAAGVALARLQLSSIANLAPEGILKLHDAVIDPRVLTFALMASTVAAILCGMTPVFSTSRTSWVRDGLLAAQIAFSLVLLTSAGFLLRTLWNLENSPDGMRAENVLTAAVSLSQQHYPDAAQELRFFEELEERMKSLPGITAAAVADSLPPVTPARSRPYMAMEAVRHPRTTEGFGGMVVWRAVTPDYFTALGIPIVRGRGFTEEDRAPGEHTMVLSEALARRMFPGEDPIGQRIRVSETFTVVGVARDVRNSASMNNDPEYYVARSRSAAEPLYSSFPTMLRRGGIVLRSSLVPRAAADMVRNLIVEIDPTLPVTVETMPQRVRKLSDRARFNFLLLGWFAAIGLVLAGVGVYGAMSFLVAQRTREIGVRIALGATKGNIARLVLSNAARWTAGGVAAGFLASLAAARLLTTLIYGVAYNDIWMLIGPSFLLCAIALAAAWLPALRAASVDPSIALRHD